MAAHLSASNRGTATDPWGAATALGYWTADERPIVPFAPGGRTTPGDVTSTRACTIELSKDATMFVFPTRLAVTTIGLLVVLFAGIVTNSFTLAIEGSELLSSTVRSRLNASFRTTEIEPELPALSERFGARAVSGGGGNALTTTLAV